MKCSRRCGTRRRWFAQLLGHRFALAPLSRLTSTRPLVHHHVDVLSMMASNSFSKVSRQDSTAVRIGPYLLVAGCSRRGSAALKSLSKRRRPRRTL